MEMDRQTILVLFGGILGLALFGGVYLSSPAHVQQERPTYSPDDIRYKFQQEALKEAKAKAKNKRKGPAPIISEEEDDSGSEESNEEPSNDEPQEEPALN